MESKLFESKPEYGFCNSRGEIIVSPRFDEAKSNKFFNAFKVGGKWGFLDEEGKCICEAQFDNIEFFLDNVIVSKRDIKVLLNSNMKRVYIPEFLSICKRGNFYIIRNTNKLYTLCSLNFDLILSGYDDIRIIESTVITLDYSGVEIYDIKDDEKLSLKKKIENGCYDVDLNLELKAMTIANQRDPISVVFVKQDKHSEIIAIDKDASHIIYLNEGEICHEAWRGVSLLKSNGKDCEFRLYYLERTEEGDIVLKRILSDEKIIYCSPFISIGKTALVNSKKKFIILDTRLNVTNEKISKELKKTIKYRLKNR